jgi:hypothetical protein
MTAFSIALGINQSSSSMKDRIIRIDRGVFISVTVEPVLGFGKILFRCRELLQDQALGSRKRDDFSVFEAFFKSPIRRPVFPRE